MEKPVIAKLTATHNAVDFDSGSEVLDRYIKLHALQSQRSSIAQTYVATTEPNIVGFHTLVVGQVVYEGSPERLVKGTPRHPVPVLLFARLAVDKRWQGKGLGAALVADAMHRVLNVADIAGVRAMLVHAKDANACRFYEYLGFEPFPEHPLTLYRLIKDMRAMQKL